MNVRLFSACFSGHHVSGVDCILILGPLFSYMVTLIFVNNLKESIFLFMHFLGRNISAKITKIQVYGFSNIFTNTIVKNFTSDPKSKWNPGKTICCFPFVQDETA